ncbi:YkgJ family cysteine cluster protein [bacterium]|nr:YkgJ family cysteine cluster protein [bacterium]
MDSSENAYAALQKEIFDQYERMNEDDTFKFRCHPGVTCFNKCCTDVNIFLTPYDIIRLKNRLGIDSDEFLTRYTIMPMDNNQHYPVVMMRLQDDEAKTCYFVEPGKGCTVYEDRPWPCRMFPIGKASPKMEEAKPFYFEMHEDICEGWKEEQVLSVRGWMEDQEVNDYDEMGELFKEVTLHDFYGDGGKLTPQQMEMFHMVCYNMDKFRLFVFETSFLNRFEIDEERIESIKKDDVELLKFGYDWLKFALYHEPTLKIREEAKPK